MALFLLILGFILIVGLVVVHEYGHFIMARRNGVEIKEFGIFFGPKLFKHKTKEGWLFSINSIPLGGFVMLKGEHDTDTEKGSYGAASLKAKSKITAAGVFMNLAIAFVMFTILAWVGMPSLLPNQFTVKSDTKVASARTIITGIENGSPAQSAGIKTFDQISAIGLPGQAPKTINSSNNLPNITKSFAGQKVDVYFYHNGTAMVKTLTLLPASEVISSQKTKNPKGYLGVTIVPTPIQVQKSTWSAPVVAAGLIVQITKLTLIGIAHAIAGLFKLLGGLVTGNKVARQNGQAAATSVGGPVLIYVYLKASSEMGALFMLFIVAYISLALAIINFLPIPPLDGGKFWITLFTRAIKHPISAKREEIISIASAMILVFLFILLTISNVKNYL